MKELLSQLGTDYGHTLFRIAEALCFYYLFVPMPKRFGASRTKGLLLLGLFVLLCALIRALVFIYAPIESRKEFIYINFIYYPLVYLLILAYCKTDARAAIYYLLLIFQSEHIPRLFSSRLYAYCLEQGVLGGSAVLLAILRTLLYAGVLLLEFYFIRKKMLVQSAGQLHWKRLVVMVMAVIPVFYIANFGVFTTVNQAALDFSTILVGYLCSLCGLVVIISYNNTVILAQKEQELIRMEAMLHSQHQQYQLKKETAEIINQKYHDLKNHLLYLNTEGADEKRRAYIRGLEQEISAYDALHQTGSEALDVILASKGIECANRGIRLLLLLNGESLSFLKPLDVAAIFGNAMDNAMEALSAVEPEARELTIRMGHSEGWLSLHFENPYRGERHVSEDGSFRSTKEDGEDHGIGLRSIAHTVGKYGGNMTAAIQDEVFVLNILFPLEKNK